MSPKWDGTQVRTFGSGTLEIRGNRVRLLQPGKVVSWSIDLPTPALAGRFVVLFAACQSRSGALRQLVAEQAA